MLEHRFRELVSARVGAITVGAPGDLVFCAFVPCPMFQSFPAVQQAQIQEIYRIAAERTREQLRPRRAFRVPEFSMN